MTGNETVLRRRSKGTGPGWVSSSIGVVRRGSTDLNDLSGRDMHEFQAWRREGLNISSERTQMATLRVFIQWCESIDAVSQGLYHKVNVPTVPDGEKASDTTLHPERAEEILDYLDLFEYATVEHVIWLILSETGMRMGAAHSLDIEDYNPDADVPHLDINHRPDTGTAIKNGQNGERPVAIDEVVVAVIDDYLDHQRPDVTADTGREPLLATSQGRPAKSTIRKYIYKWSRPCEIGAGCPHHRDPDECDVVSGASQASKCPSSVSPHPIRRGYITHLLHTGVAKDVVSDRCNVSPGIIDQHYDVRSEEDKMKQRQQVLKDIT
ncbi:MAG: site-specific integrase [Halodesulfurarchaeum sp.]|nr:site-specific integrase [Halodesulfurarchaeum sp.]